MSNNISTDYDISDVSATFDGLQLVGSGLWEGDDVISVEYVDDIGTGITGADGSGAWSQHASRAAIVTVQIMAGSVSHRKFHQVMEAQREGSTKKRPFTFNDRRINEGGQCEFAKLQAAPGPKKGKAQTMREWKFWTPNWVPNIPTGEAA